MSGREHEAPEHGAGDAGRPAPGASPPQADRVRWIDLAPSEARLLDVVQAGLGASPRRLPCALFYDAEGSRLFDEICSLPEYYVPRIEAGLLRERGPDIARLAGPGVEVVELGCGSAHKTDLLLDALERPAAYVALDVSREPLLAATRRIAAARPALDVWALCADYTQPFSLPERDGPRAKRLAFFPGSTIGNFDPEQARRFLGLVARLVGPGGDLLIGADLPKDKAVLDRAYDDARGVTAAFNKNVLARINRELGADFDLDAFDHLAFFDPERSRVEMHLVSLKDQVAHVGGREYAFREGERLHTESSYKYGVDPFRRMAAAAGFVSLECWTDAERMFSMHYLRVPAA
jgi:dimethylhistidine N-methyltransferase